jgi:hypothetical protein
LRVPKMRDLGGGQLFRNRPHLGPVSAPGAAGQAALEWDAVRLSLLG